MRSKFMFKEKCSDDFHIIVNSLPPITKPPKKIEVIEIDGLNGDITVDNGYAAYDKDIQITFKKRPDYDELIRWLTGAGKLILSNEPEKYYDAAIWSGVDISRDKALYKARITFHVQPYKHLISEKKATGTNTVTVVNQGFDDSLPVIKITGSGEVEVKIDNVTICKVNIDDEYIILDSEKQEAYKEATLKNRQMSGEFVKLPRGKTTITTTGTVTAIEVEPRSRWV